MEGIRVIRAGRQWTVHLAAFWRYRGRIKDSFDVIVDEVNTIPFFTPLWSDIPCVMFIHQLAREVWWYESPFPINAIGFGAESLYLRCYRGRAVATVSRSTEADLRGLGFHGHITVVPEGLECIVERPTTKASLPTFLYVGRLAPSKRIDHIIRAFAVFRKAAGPSRLWLIGTGTPKYSRALSSLAEGLGLGQAVEFLGRTPTHEKHKRMAEAHALLMASVREGWGLVVIEANACGTPAVVYDVPGLRDSVRHEETGLAVSQSPADLAKGMLRIWNDPALYTRLAGNARRWSNDFTFDNSTRVFAESLAGAMR